MSRSAGPLLCLPLDIKRRDDIAFDGDRIFAHAEKRLWPGLIGYDLTDRLAMLGYNQGFSRLCHFVHKLQAPCFEFRGLNRLHSRLLVNPDYS